MAEYNHIEIMREEIVRQYKFQPNRNPPRPPERNRTIHGEKLRTQIAASVDSIVSKRRDRGIQSENLVVLELMSDALSPELLEHLVRKFDMYLVEETDIPNSNNSKLLVQFENVEAIRAFNNERALWEDDIEYEAVLTNAKRRDIFSCIENIRCLTKEDRIGTRLKEYFDNSSLMPDGLFVVNIDVWFNGDTTTIYEVENQIRKVLGTGESRLLGDLLQIPSLLLGRALVNEFTLNALLDLDIIANVELPIGKVFSEPYELFQGDYNPIIENHLGDDAPLATVLDSGIFTANPLLEDVVVAEEEFDTTENSTTDMNGHGTGVAGIVVYGDLDKCLQENIFRPLVRVCNGKIMHDENNIPCFPEDKRPEQIVKDAIEYFYNEYHCRVFNLSVGDADNVYTGGRQFAWAEMLDQLSRELDIVIIISAGNVSQPLLREFDSRDSLMEQARNQMFYPEHRIIDPATAALGITVGAITRFEEPTALSNRFTRISAGKKDYLSVFTRIGKGVNRSVKPELVDYGGNYAVSQIVRGSFQWEKNDMRLLEPTLNNGNERIFRGYCGTSFSAPHVTHIAARIERALEKQLEKKPSANLIRAILINSARYSKEMVEWGENSTDELYRGGINPKQERKMRLYGFGKSDDSLLYSDFNRVTLFSEDKLPLRSFHLYKIPVPKEFLQIQANKTIAISLAYNPETKLSRKDYLANNLWFEVFRKIDDSTLLLYKAKKEEGTDSEDDLERFPNKYKTQFSPGYREINKGTLQQRIWQKGSRGGSDLLWDDNDPFIYVLVTGKEKFKYANQEIPQDYALAITFSYECQDDIQLYTKLKATAKIRPRQAERERARGRR
ncbi:MAG: S8 family peptidase [Anaerovoracaceae bacterium]|nr:S8 family peptidase [Anaerovoracaceae bacterium]